MKRSLGILAGTAVGALLLWAASAVANHVGGEPNEEEVKCQVKSAGIYGTFVLKKALKVVKCEKGERDAKNPALDCEPPYGGETGTKIGELQVKTTDKHIAACPDCPECYTGGNCAADGAGKTSGVEAQIDGFHGFVWCDETGSPDGLKPDEAKCQDGVGKFLAKGVKKVTKIAGKCIKGEHAGDGSVAPGDCEPTAGPDYVGDPEANAKLTDSIQKTADKINDKCAGVALPECYVPNFDTGEEWVAFTQSVVEQNYTTFFCNN